MAKPYVLFDSREERTYEDYLDFCKANNIEPQGEDSEDYHEIVEEMKSWDYNDLLSNIKHCVYNRQKWVAEGTLGLWNGQREIVPKVFDSLFEAIIACTHRCDYIKITKNHRTIEVEATHHDGTNYFTLKCLSDLGEIRYGNNGQVSLNNRKNIMTLPQWLF